MQNHISEESVVSSGSEQNKKQKSDIDDLFRKVSDPPVKKRSSRTSAEVIDVIDSK